MLELASALLEALAAGRRLAVATVVEVDGSAPRALGTSMAVDDEGRVIGSISGGCVEGSVYDACQRVLESHSAELCTFGFTDDDAFAVGLSCGGRITVVVRELSAADGELLAELRVAREGGAAGLALLVPEHEPEHEPGPEHEPEQSGALGPDGGRFEVELLTASSPSAPDARRQRIRSELLAAVHRGRSVRRQVDCEGELVPAVLLVSAPPARMIVFGAVDFSVALSNAAALVGYRVTVCDARPVFATPERFPAAEVVNRWPTDYLAETSVDERTVLCILTHDDKFDVPLIEAALALDVAYVGAMGSRATHERRLLALRERGVTEQALSALHSPIGLDVGASSPEETAVSILAEVIAARTGSSGAELRRTRGAIHTSRGAVDAGRGTVDAARSADDASRGAINTTRTQEIM